MFQTFLNVSEECTDELPPVCMGLEKEELDEFCSDSDHANLCKKTCEKCNVLEFLFYLIYYLLIIKVLKYIKKQYFIIFQFR